MSTFSRKIRCAIETIQGVQNVRLSSHFTYVPDPIDSRSQTTGKSHMIFVFSLELEYYLLY